MSTTHSCESCSRPIKARLVRIRIKPPKKCYRCYKASKVVNQRRPPK